MSIAVGVELPVRHVTVNREGMKPMAVMLRDPNPIHWDLEVLRELGLDERPVNQGPTNLAYVWDALTAWIGDVAAIKNVDVRFVSNALADEDLSAGGARRGDRQRHWTGLLQRVVAARRRHTRPRRHRDG